MLGPPRFAKNSDCRGAYPVVKCTYCRTEFQQENKSSTNAICKKCAQNVKIYGTPKPCEYCNVIAAFIGNKCQRCSNSEKKYGPPHTCEQCKQKCAFDRKDERKKVDGKLLCWLCTLSYKRVLQKARKRKYELTNREHHRNSSSDAGTRGSNNGGGNTGGGAGGGGGTTGNGGGGTNTPSALSPTTNATAVTNQNTASPLKNRNRDTPTSMGRNRPESSGGGGSSGSGSGSKFGRESSREGRDRGGEKERERDRERHRDRNRDRDRDKDKKEDHRLHKSSKSNDKKQTLHEPDVKRTKLEHSSNGALPSASSKTDMTFIDPGNTDHMVAMTQLREQVASLKKVLAEKEKAILEKDKKLTEVKAIQMQIEKDLRAKLQTLQKEHQDTVDDLQAKNRALTKQVAQLSKTSKDRDKEKDKEKLII
nr:protein FAM76A-like [Lytechinus pictus]